MGHIKTTKMKINKEDLLKYLKIFRKTTAWIIIGILAFSGFLRFVELNTTCNGYMSYYEFQDTNCMYSGFLNHKIKCEMPVGVPIDCRANLGIFSFNVLKSNGTAVFSDNYDYFNDFNFSSNFSIN